MPTIANGNPFSTLCAETESKKKKNTHGTENYHQTVSAVCRVDGSTVSQL